MPSSRQLAKFLENKVSDAEPFRRRKPSSRHSGLAPESHSPRHCGPGFDPAFRHCGLAPQSGSFHYAEQRHAGPRPGIDSASCFRHPGQRHPGLDPGSIQHLISRIYSGTLNPLVFPESFRNFLPFRHSGLAPESIQDLISRIYSGASSPPVFPESFRNFLPSRHSGLAPESQHLPVIPGLTRNPIHPENTKHKPINNALHSRQSLEQKFP